MLRVVCYIMCFLSYRNVSLDIKMKLEKTPAYNVIGTITGREEPGTTFEYLVFFLYSLHQKGLIYVLEYFFRVYIASSKHEKGWENSRQLCKPET